MEPLVKEIKGIDGKHAFYVISLFAQQQKNN